MTNSIYDVELYSASFLFSYEEYLSVKSHAELPLKCSHCGETFYRQKKQITSAIKKNKLKFYCCKKCADKDRIKPKEETTHTCKFCGKEFTVLPSKYASGDFCSKDCAIKYSSRFANTYECRKKKSVTICDRLGISHENKTEKEIYYRNCVFRFGIDDFKRVEGFDLIQKYGMYSPHNNLDGVARDHMVSRHYGWTHNIPPEVIRHPANCRIINQRENASKGEKCCITIEELYERIKNW